jgi:hypothetical protein
MKRVIALVFVTALCVVPAANAAAPKGPTVAEFKALQKKVTKDEKRITVLEGALNAAFAVMACENAVIADAFQATWQQEDAFATSLGRPAVYGTQTPITDSNACAAFRNPIVRSHTVPHNTSVFSALAALLGP